MNTFKLGLKKITTLTVHYNLQNHRTFHSEDRLVNLVRRRERFVGLSSYQVVYSPNYSILHLGTLLFCRESESLKSSRNFSPAIS